MTIYAVFTIYKQDLVNFSTNCLKVSEQEADDLTQEIFLKLLEKEKKGILPSIITNAFLRTMLKNTFIDQLRKHKKVQKTLEIYKQINEKRAGVYAEIDMEHLHYLIQKGIFLSKTEAKIWQIYCQQNYDRQKTAQHLNQSLNYIDQYLYLIRKKIRANIALSNVVKSKSSLHEQMKEL